MWVWIGLALIAAGSAGFWWALAAPHEMLVRRVSAFASVAAFGGGVVLVIVSSLYALARAISH